MVIVAIIGLLAAVALPAFVTYLRRSKASEATQSLGTIHRLAAAYYAGEFSANRSSSAAGLEACTVGPTGPLPATIGPESALVEWHRDPSFGALAFAVGGPAVYSYEIISSGRCSNSALQPLYSYRAYGDLDGDGVTSLYELSAGSNDANALLHTPGFFITDPVE